MSVFTFAIAMAKENRPPEKNSPYGAGVFIFWTDVSKKSEKRAPLKLSAKIELGGEKKKLQQFDMATKK